MGENRILNKEIIAISLTFLFTGIFAGAEVYARDSVKEWSFFITLVLSVILSVCLYRMIIMGKIRYEAVLLSCVLVVTASTNEWYLMASVGEFMAEKIQTFGFFTAHGYF